ncbi:hypothetical protein YC2023_115062 [Brassica napus]
MKVLVNQKLGSTFTSLPMELIVNGVYHRDLKVVSFADNQQSFQTKSDFDCFYCQLQPKNLLLHSQGNLKISDFGLSALPEQVMVVLRSYHSKDNLWNSKLRCSLVIRVTNEPYDERTPHVPDPISQLEDGADGYLQSKFYK